VFVFHASQTFMRDK